MRLHARSRSPPTPTSCSGGGSTVGPKCGLSGVSSAEEKHDTDLRKAVQSIAISVIVEVPSIGLKEGFHEAHFRILL
jgi:hypothetical protein